MILSTALKLVTSAMLGVYGSEAASDVKTFSLNATITSLPPFSHLRGVVVKKTTVVDPSVDNRSMPRDPKSDSNTGVVEGNRVFFEGGEGIMTANGVDTGSFNPVSVFDAIATNDGGNNGSGETIQAFGSNPTKDTRALGGHFETEGGGMDTYTEELLPMEIGHGGSGDVRGNRGSDSLAIYGGSEDDSAHPQSVSSGPLLAFSPLNTTMSYNKYQKDEHMKASLKSLLHMEEHGPSSTTSIIRQLQSDYWAQVGGDLNAAAAGDQSIVSIGMSSDGSVLAIGARYNDDNGISSGHVRVYEYNGSTYTKRGNTIVGAAAGDQFGHSVDMSNDGSVLAIGARTNDDNGSESGHVRVYAYNGSTYTQRGDTIVGGAASDRFGISVDMSSDGSVLAIGATDNCNSGISGYVQVYAYNGSTYTQRGSTIVGAAAGDQFGWSVSMSSDGSVLAIGARTNDDNGRRSGHVRAYEYNGSTYTQRGNTIVGVADADYFGHSVDMASDGSVLAIGAQLNDDNGNRSGHVRVYEYNGSTYIQRGGTIVGAAAGDEFGMSIGMSSDGSVLAIGAPYNDDNGSNKGHVRAYEYNGKAYTQRGNTIVGAATGDWFGHSVSMSSDGSVLAIGARNHHPNEGNGIFSDYAQVYACPSPWEIHFLALSANFGFSSDDELILNYDIGKDRQYETLLFLKDCTTNVTGITINYSEHVLTPKNPTFNTLTLGYSIDKSMIANSPIWNATSSQIELCQVVQLKEGNIVIIEEFDILAIDFNLWANYEISNTSLGAATFNDRNDTTDVTSYIEACKCDGVSFNCNTNAIVPNAELIVCIKSISPDVEIDFLESMILSQVGANDMSVIEDNVVVFPSFTSREYVTAKNGVVASTRVSPKLFDYNSPGSVIGITGGLVLQLVGSDRKLKAAIGAKFDASEEVSFEIEVNLQREMLFGGEASMTSATSATSNKGSIALSMVLAWAYVMW